MKSNELHEFVELYELKNISELFSFRINYLITGKFFNREQAEAQAQRQRQLAKQRAATSKTRDELEKQEKKGSIYRRKMMVGIFIFPNC
jgi:hypothetical protein